MPKTIKPSYKVNRLKDDKGFFYHIHHDGKYDRVRNTDQGWYCKTRYFKTLRDAIIYCVFGH
ncbi:hypothetical protein [Vibrio phage vB_VhaS-tm]|nr:hypothetical protein [Vibrio phage vB_VhaS-tm]